MTVDDIRHMDRDFLTPAIVGPVLGRNPYSINIQAHKDPSKLGFPVCVCGRRVSIPRLGFLHWYDHGEKVCAALNEIATNGEISGESTLPESEYEVPHGLDF